MTLYITRHATNPSGYIAAIELMASQLALRLGLVNVDSPEEQTFTYLQTASLRRVIDADDLERVRADLSVRTEAYMARASFGKNVRALAFDMEKAKKWPEGTEDELTEPKIEYELEVEYIEGQDVRQVLARMGCGEETLDVEAVLGSGEDNEGTGSPGHEVGTLLVPGKKRRASGEEKTTAPKATFMGMQLSDTESKSGSDAESEASGDEDDEARGDENNKVGGNVEIADSGVRGKSEEQPRESGSNRQNLRSRSADAVWERVGGRFVKKRKYGSA